MRGPGPGRPKSSGSAAEVTYDPEHAENDQYEHEDYTYNLTIKWVALFFVWGFAILAALGLVGFKGAVLFALVTIITAITAIE